MKIGYFLSCEEWGPRELVGLAVKAEQAGFEGLWISDHYHPWNDEQGHSPFVWAVIGAIARATARAGARWRAPASSRGRPRSRSARSARSCG